MKLDDWDGVNRFNPFDDGRYQADRVCRRSTRWLRNALAMARVSRGRLVTRLFRASERRYLDGFIGRVEEELRRRATDGEPDTRAEANPA